MAKKFTTEIFIERARKVHGDRYDYSKVEYVNNKTNVCIICPEHGEFLQTPNSHLEGKGCRSCFYENGIVPKWNKVSCYKEALNYKSRSEFFKKNGSAYNAAKKNGWLDDYIWFEVLRRKRWTYDSCYVEAKKYKSLIEFRKNSNGAYTRALRNKWLSDYTWLQGSKHQNWTYEECLEIAKKYHTKKEFLQNNHFAYHAAQRNHWIDDFTWLTDDRIFLFKDRIDFVYYYFFEQQNAIYVGRTIRPRGRDKEHIFGEEDTVSRFAKDNNCAVPEMVIIEENLTLQEGLEQENFWTNYFKDQGYLILNKAATGVGKGSLGAIGNNRWNKTSCFKEAKKYQSRSEFNSCNGAAYGVALKNGWLNDYDWFREPVGRLEDRYSELTCEEESKKYNSRMEFAKGNPSAYKLSLQKKWIERYVWLKRPTPKSKYTEDYCLQIAREYTSYSDFRRKEPGVWRAAHKNKWLTAYTWLTRERAIIGYWTKERCKEEALKYKSRKSFKIGASYAYASAIKNHWIDEYTWFIETSELIAQNKTKWNYDACYQEAKKYNSRGAFSEGTPGAWAIAKKAGWMKDYTWFVEKKKPNGYWTYEKCKSEARKYKSKSEFRKECNGAYDAAKKHGWLNEFFSIEQGASA